jgi:hypothetical protein
MCEIDLAAGSVHCLAWSPSRDFTGRFVIVGNEGGKKRRTFFSETTKQDWPSAESHMESPGLCRATAVEKIGSARSCTPN